MLLPFVAIRVRYDTISLPLQIPSTAAPMIPHLLAQHEGSQIASKIQRHLAFPRVIVRIDVCSRRHVKFHALLRHGCGDLLLRSVRLCPRTIFGDC
jgi:hypothetical protein